MTLLDRNPTFADAYAQQIGKAVEKATKAADTLKWIAGDEGDVYLNFGKYESPDMFSGDNAAARARWSAEDSEDDRDPHPEYKTTIVLHPDGTWTEQYLFRV